MVTTRKLGNVKLWPEGRMLLLAGLDNFCMIRKTIEKLDELF
jgi:hypothetical protein